MPCFACSANRVVRSDTVAEKHDSEVVVSHLVSESAMHPSYAAPAMATRPFAQLLLVDSGVMRVTVPSGHWTVQLPDAMWIPAFTFHQMETDSKLDLYTVSLPKDCCCAHFSTESRVVRVSALLRELIHRMAEAPRNYDEEGRYGKIARLIPEELDWSPVQNIRLPLLQDSRLRGIQEILLANPTDRRTLQQWADFMNTSCRTLARLFQKEVNVCFCDWRNQLRLSVALPMLSRGESVTSVAFSVGFESAGTFTTMFRQFMGISPSQYASRSRTDSTRC